MLKSNGLNFANESTKCTLWLEKLSLCYIFCITQSHHFNFHVVPKKNILWMLMNNKYQFHKQLIVWGKFVEAKNISEWCSCVGVIGYWHWEMSRKSQNIMPINSWKAVN